MINYPDKTRKLGCQGWPSILTGNGYLLSDYIHVMRVAILVIAVNRPCHIIRDLHAPVLMRGHLVAFLQVAAGRCRDFPCDCPEGAQGHERAAIEEDVGIPALHRREGLCEELAENRLVQAVPM